MGFIEILKRELLSNLSNLTIELIGISENSFSKKDENGAITSEKQDFIKVECEVQRNQGAYSRIRFSVKVPDGRMKVNPEDLENELLVKFDDLSVSFIDNRGNIYFRASDYTVIEV